jgi:glycosyltransferase involved in cell wall biosynthesis
VIQQTAAFSFTGVSAAHMKLESVHPSSENQTPLRPISPGIAFPIIVHSHLGWDWVWQRPQQFHSRLSQRHRILFVEGPVARAGLTAAQVTLREVADYSNLVVLQMEMPAERWSDGAWVDKERRRLVESVLAGPLGADFQDPVQWFYDPMAVTAFAGHLNESAIVYDCMDQLSKFRGAPAELVRRERELLAIADVVFAGGPKIWKDKVAHNANCYSFGCGVDVEHFGKAIDAATVVPADIANLPRPIYGYIGVVDERIDYGLVEKLAEKNAEGSVVMIGPWTKVDANTFPRRENLHWLGQRDYGRLPAYAKGFDVCLMPFALNEATEFINPTKALEYMATGRPIVSTAIEDVIVQFEDVVKVARTREEFVWRCERAAKHPNVVALRRGLKLAKANTWESIVSQLEGHVADVLNNRRSMATDAA